MCMYVYAFTFLNGTGSCISDLQSHGVSYADARVRPTLCVQHGGPGTWTPQAAKRQLNAGHIWQAYNLGRTG